MSDILLIYRKSHRNAITVTVMLKLNLHGILFRMWLGTQVLAGQMWHPEDAHPTSISDIRAATSVQQSATVTG